MKWLTLSLIKKQLRLETDFTDDDDLLTIYGDSAEGVILNTTRRTVNELKAMNADDQSKVPAEIVQASLMLCEVSYTNRSPVSMQNLYIVPYNFDMIIKPFMKLSKEDTV